MNDQPITISQYVLDEFHKSSQTEQDDFIVAVDGIRLFGFCSLIPFTNVRWLVKFDYFNALDRTKWAEELLEKLAESYNPDADLDDSVLDDLDNRSQYDIAGGRM